MWMSQRFVEWLDSNSVSMRNETREGLRQKTRNTNEWKKVYGKWEK